MSKSPTTRLHLLCLLMLLCGVLAPTARAQDEPIARQLDVFVQQNAETGASTIYFLDALSGLSTVAHVENGHRFTLVGDYVLYEKTFSGAIMRADPDGTISAHSFIRRAVDTESITWITSPDRAALAWVMVNEEGVSEAYIAWAEGEDYRQLPINSPAAPAELIPVAINNERTRFFFDDAHTSNASPYPVYDVLALYDITDEEFVDLPDEPNCACGAAFSVDGRIFARLEATHPNEVGGGPFALRVWDLPTNASFFIPAPALEYRYAGDLLLDAYGTRAVYSAAAGVGVEATTHSEEYTLILVDIVGQQQSPILLPDPVRYRPVAFIDGEQGLLLVAPGTGGTYKLDLLTGTVLQVSDLTYLGTITTTR